MLLQNSHSAKGARSVFGILNTFLLGCFKNSELYSDSTRVLVGNKRRQNIFFKKILSPAHHRSCTNQFENSSIESIVDEFDSDTLQRSKLAISWKRWRCLATQAGNEPSSTQTTWRDASHISLCCCLRNSGPRTAELDRHLAHLRSAGDIAPRGVISDAWGRRPQL